MEVQVKRKDWARKKEKWVTNLKPAVIERDSLTVVYWWMTERKDMTRTWLERQR